MKIVSSLKNAKNRNLKCKVIKRCGKIFVVNKSHPRFKARQR